MKGLSACFDIRFQPIHTFGDVFNGIGIGEPQVSFTVGTEIDARRHAYMGVVENVKGDNFIMTGRYDAELIKGGYLDQVTRMQEVRQQLKNYVIQSVNNKKGFQEYLRGIKELVTSSQARDGMIERYYKQFAYDTFNQTDAAINKHYADSLELTWFVYSGGTITTSRQFCIKRADKVYNTEETEKWKCDPYLIGKPKGVRCDQRYNPLIERGRWNCRHSIRYITESLACQRGREEACEEIETPNVKTEVSRS
jgi:hypothetical protein